MVQTPDIDISPEVIQEFLVGVVIFYALLTILMNYTRNIWVVMGNVVVFIFVSFMIMFSLSFLIAIYSRIWEKYLPKILENIYYKENYKLLYFIFIISNTTYISSALWFRHTNFDFIEFLIDFILDILLLHI